MNIGKPTRKRMFFSTTGTVIASSVLGMIVVVSAKCPVENNLSSICDDYDNQQQLEFFSSHSQKDNLNRENDVFASSNADPCDFSGPYEHLISEFFEFNNPIIINTHFSHEIIVRGP